MTEATYQREKVQDLWQEVMPLLSEHWLEIAYFKNIPLAPDFKGYEALEQANMLRCFTARVDGQLVGYSAFFVRRHLHYITSLQAAEDVIFLLPEYRNSRIGLGLIKYSEQQLFAEGVDVINHHAKKDHPALGAVLEHNGYELVDLIYMKQRAD